MGNQIYLEKILEEKKHNQQNFSTYKILISNPFNLTFHKQNTAIILMAKRHYKICTIDLNFQIDPSHTVTYVSHCIHSQNLPFEVL